MNNSSKIDRIVQTSQFYEPEEGGLNLVAFKDVIWRKMPIVFFTTAIFSSLAFLQAINRTPLYQSGFEILSEPVTIETKVSSSGSQSRETTEEITAVKLNEVQIKTLKSPSIINAVVEQLQNKYPDLNYSSIVNNLDVKTTNEDETVLQVTYKHPDSQLVKDVLDTLANTYLDYSLQRRQSGVRRGLEFLDQQIPRLQTKVDQLNSQLQEIRQKYNFIEPSIQEQQISERLDGLIKQQLDTKSQLNNAQWNANLVQKELAKKPNSSTAALESGTPRYRALLDDLRGLDSQIAKKSAIYSDNNIELQTLREQRQKIIGLLDREGEVIDQKLDNQISNLQDQNQYIDRDINNLREQIKQWSGVTQDYEDIQRQINITVKQLNELLIQREALKIESAQKEAPWRLLTPVGEAQTDSASTVNYVVLGTLLGLLIGVGIALVVDKAQNRLYTSNRVQEITNLPILGIIPYERSLKKSFFGKKMIELMQSNDDNNNSGIQLYDRFRSAPNFVVSSTEPFRFFGANLGLFEADSSLRSFMITSAIPGEGKSTIAFNLAKISAVMGKRVLLVDTDLRSSSTLSNNLPLTQNIGLTDILKDPNLKLHDVIQQSTLEENLYILAHGTDTNLIEPSKLLVSRRMKKIMETVKQHFDLVIYDVSSVVNYADVSLLATKTDGIILVTGLGKLKSVKLQEAMKQLNISNTPLLGIVINQVAS